MRRAVGLVGFLLVFAAMGVGGFFLWKLQERQRLTLRRLGETQAALEQHQQTMTLIKDERRTLADAYETLRTRWSSSDEELGRLKAAAGRMTKDLAEVSNDRTSMSKELLKSREELAGMRSQLDGLQSELLLTEMRKAELETQLKDAASSTLTPAEVEQLGLALARSQDEQDALRAKLLELSRAYESMAVAPSPGLSDSGQAPRPAADALSGETSARDEAIAVQERATRYRLLGEAYLASHRYPEAAEAFEQSLAYVDDPDVHTHLVFLYSRILHNPEKAVFHRARAPSRIDATTTSLQTTAGATNLPRNQRKLIWEWLTK